jgi:hypothetical protein
MGLAFIGRTCKETNKRGISSVLGLCCMLSRLINFEATQKDVSFVNNFQGLFPKDLPRLPLDHEIKFCIELGLRPRGSI